MPWLKEKLLEKGINEIEISTAAIFSINIICLMQLLLFSPVLSTMQL